MIDGNPRILVGIVEDNWYYADALEHMLQRVPDLSVVGVWQDAETALMEISHQLPHVMLMDIQLPGMNGIECIRKMRMISSGLQFLMLTQSVEDENVFDALKAGACGYLLKAEGHEMVIRSIRELRAGGSPMSGHIARKLVNFFNRLPVPESDSEPLTRREQEVLALLAEGRLYKEVSAELGIAMETAKKHVRNIYSKLQVQNRTEALNKWRLFNYDLT